MSRKYCVCFALALWFVCSWVQGADITRLQVSREQGDYRLFLQVDLAVSRERVWAILTDYKQLSSLSETVISSEVVTVDAAGATQVKTVLQGCILFYCRDLTQIQWLTKQAPYVLTAVTAQGESDFEHNAASWVLTDIPGGCRMVFVAEFRPAFWVPPLIGPWAIEDGLISDAKYTVRQIELRAQTL